MRNIARICWVVALSIALTTPAQAQWERGYRHHGGGWVWGGVGIAAVITGLAIEGAVLNAPPYYGQPVYAAPIYTDPSPVYVAPQTYATPPMSNIWYFCRSSAMYYPYTRACPEGWEQVPARPEY